MEDYTKVIDSDIDNLITGGYADNKSLEQIANKHNISLDTLEAQLKIGIGIEMEHTNDSRIAKEIALDHLWEIPDYYTRLDKMEKGYEKEQNQSDKPLNEDMKSLSGLALKHIKEEELFILYNMDIYKNVQDADYAKKYIIGVIQYRYNNQYSAYEVDRVASNKGYGPQLYLILMSYAGKDGLIPSRVKGEISDEAKKVWKEFYNGVGSKYVEVYDLKDDDNELSDHHEEDYLNKRYVIKRKINIKSLLSKDKSVKDPHGELNDIIWDYSATFLFNKLTDAYRDKINDSYIPSFEDNKIEVEENGKNIGFFVFENKLSRNSKDLFISHLEINPKYRNMGYFKTLMNHMLNFAKTHDYETITLETDITQGSKYSQFLEKLYKKYEFNIVPNDPSLLTKEVNENVLFEDYPAGFDMEYFKSLPSFNKKIQYANDKLRRLGSGSARIVYQIDDEKVLKLAKNKKGLAQNEVEYRLGNDYYFNDINAEVFDADEDNYSWIEMQLAKKLTPNRFKHLVGIDFNTYVDLLERYLQNVKSTGYKLDPLTNDQYEFIENNEFLSTITNILSNYKNIEFGDLYRMSSYGEVDGEVVLVDFGLDDDVYKSHYLKEDEAINIKDKVENFDFSKIDLGKLKKAVNYVEKLPSNIKGNVSTLYRFYFVNVQNIKDGLELAKNNLKYYNNLLRLQDYLKNVGLIKENNEKLSNHKFEYGCLMLNFKFPEWKDILWHINIDDVYNDEEGFGLEKEPHITILYGFHDNNGNLHNKIFKLFDNVNDYIEGEIVGIGIFESEKYDVLKLDIKSPTLTELNKYFTDNYEYTNKYEDYNPHMTIGYFKKGQADKYVKELKNPINIKSKILQYSNPNKEKYKYIIGGKKEDIYESRRGFSKSDYVNVTNEDIKGYINKAINYIERYEKKDYLSQEDLDDVIYYYYAFDYNRKRLSDIIDYVAANNLINKIKKILLSYKILKENRKISYMPGASKVSVKDKCKLGGLPDGTSVACNQGDINALNIEPINEVGEATSRSFGFKKKQFTEKKSEYVFKTEKEKLNYRVIIEETYDKGQFDIHFDIFDPIKGTYHSRTVNEGNPYRVMATVLQIIEEDLKERKEKFNQQINELTFFPINEDVVDDNDNRREKFYLAYLKKLKPEWKFTKNELGIIVIEIDGD